MSKHPPKTDTPPGETAPTRNEPPATIEVARPATSGESADSAGTIDHQASSETGDFHPNSPGRGASAIAGASFFESGATSDFTSSGPGTHDSLRTLDITARPPREMPTLPGYEIKSELGRGGMGVVYKAKQLGLNRTVALKMVLAGAHASPDKLARFQTEAIAVARVQHPNIVQIYEVGEHNGLPYFSLEFIDGGPLDKRIDRQPQKPREAAELMEPLARAMHFAHQQSIVHRDLKPANILVTAAGVPKVTDFGLAKAVEDEDSHTRSGTILGSPSYMAPEQARGDVRDVGPHSDQYGLGAILYELLTGRPPFQGATVFDTLDQVQTRDPVPPTQLAARVPVDLETICLKCLQKEPGKRYADCGALADDLLRFLNNEPILARPVGSVERLWRWCKRNPKIAALSATSLALLMVGLGVTTAFAITFARQNEVIAKEKQTAETQRGIAQSEAIEAKKQRQLAETAAAEEKRQRQIADAARTAADESAQLSTQQATLALNTIQTLVSTVQQKLGEAPGTQQLKKEVLQLAMKDLGRVADNVGKSTSKEATLLAVFNQLGKVFKQLGETDKSAEMFRKGLEIARERVVLKEGSDAARGNLASSLRDMADVTQEIGRDMQAALQLFEEALSVRQDIVDHPKPGEGAAKPFLVKYELAEDHTRVAATIYRLGDPARALPHFRQAAAIRKGLLGTIETDPDMQSFPAPQRAAIRGQVIQDLARSNLGVGEMSFRLKDTSSALTGYSDGLAIRQKLFDANQKNAGFRFELARTHGNFGDIYLHIDEPAEAEKHYQAALAHMQTLADADKENAIYQRDLGLAWYRLGNFAQRQGQTTVAAEHFARAKEIREALVAKDPANDRRQMELMLALAHCGEHERAADLADKYRNSATTDNELLLDVARAYAQCAVAAGDMPEAAERYARDAVKAIAAAVEQGYKDAVYLEREVDLDPIRTLPEFQTLLKQAGQESRGSEKT